LSQHIKSDTFNTVEISFNPAKREVTLRERGLDFADAGKVFEGRHIVLPSHRSEEERYISAGYLSGRMVILVWTPRENKRHVISMRHCHAKEETYWKERMDRSG
jgi:uncharacterized DUF497 family protein